VKRAHAILIWGALAIAVIVPVFLAADSPLLAWRRPAYIAAGFAGVIAMTLLLIQPLLAGGYLPGLPKPHGRRVHRLIGSALVLAVIVHVVGLWLTFVSPTPFSAWGVIAMWAVFASALLAIFRRRLRLRTWRLGHTALIVVTVACSVVHALLIEGTMETITKTMLCILAVLTTAKTIYDLRVWARRAGTGSPQ